MTKDDLHDRMTELAEEMLEEAKPFLSTQLGLDSRSSYLPLMATVDFVAVAVSQDRGLQYYGGFEYVDKDNRMEVGNWVLYFAEGCQRVQDCIDSALNLNPDIGIDSDTDE